MNVLAKHQQPATHESTDVFSRAFWRDVAIASLLVLAFMVAITLSITPRYETIDDIVMHEYVAGLFLSLKPNDHMIYTHVLLGKLLAGLYSFAANVPWYPLYQMAALFASSTIICAAFVKLYGGRGAIVPSLSFALTVLAPAIICIQFTTTAAIVGIAGGVLLISSIESRASWKWRWLLASGGAFAFVFAALMRQKAGWMVAVLFAVYAVVKYFGKSWRKLGIALAATAALAGISQVFWIANDSYYRQTGWGEFEVWRRKLHPLYDFARLDLKSDGAVATMKTVGWSRNDFKMLNTCMHWDKDVFSTAKLGALVDKGHRWVRSDVRSYLPKAFARLVKHSQAQVALYLLAASFLITAGQHLSSRRFAILVAAVAGVATVTTMTHKASLHVYLPMLYVLAVARLTSLQFGKPTPDPSAEQTHSQAGSAGKVCVRAAPFAYSLLILLGCIGFFAQLVQDHNLRLSKTVNSASARHKDLMLVRERYPNKLAYTVVGAPSILPFENIEPFKGIKVVSSYTSRMSFGKELLAMHQISDFGEGFHSGKVLVLSNTRQNKALATFFKEHYGVKVQFKRIPTDGSENQGIYEVVVRD